MQRYFTAPEQISGGFARIIGEDVHHILRVMRCRPGDRIIVCAGTGTDYLCEITETGAEEVLCRIVSESPSTGEPVTRLWIAQSLTKGDKWEWVLQKGTEIGAAGFIPFTSERCLIKIDEKKADKKQARWRKIVKEAAEQSHRGRVPEVAPVMNWKDLLRSVARFEAAFLAWEKGGKALKRAIAETEASEILLIVGPEGGFSEREAEEAAGSGAVPISLGSRILRAETAPLFAASCILFARNDLGGETE
ncbi:16S rRNA (uracil(1498)-N(3))-methyltransferase [Staphylospora marina]|uniref:16S rRNA (uracil(1498)-N(3))-methyltransferase n=1 Tax=Staphylospora marina TaxID=2490858 RepID=UPI000F5C161D|nr:16S rRNA (uracil(1498)-N(3))-methyltransferase [Staphylospora marina]